MTVDEPTPDDCGVAERADGSHPCLSLNTRIKNPVLPWRAVVAFRLPAPQAFLQLGLRANLSQYLLYQMARLGQANLSSFLVCRWARELAELGSNGPVELVVIVAALQNQFGPQQPQKMQQRRNRRAAGLRKHVFRTHNFARHGRCQLVRRFVRVRRIFSVFCGRICHGIISFKVPSAPESSAGDIACLKQSRPIADLRTHRAERPAPRRHPPREVALGIAVDLRFQNVAARHSAKCRAPPLPKRHRPRHGQIDHFRPPREIQASGPENGIGDTAAPLEGVEHAPPRCERYPAGRRCSGRGDQYSAIRISQNALPVLVSRRSRARDARSTGRKP
jgi:hypothetical protein